MPHSDVIGYIAAILTTLAFVPQALLVWRTRRADGISLGMYSIFTIGMAFWVTYGFMLWSWPIIVANLVTLALALFIPAMKIKHK